MELEFRSLPGLTSYEAARTLQQELVEKRVRGEIPDTILFLEHQPVITRGRGLQWKPGSAKDQPRQMPFSPQFVPRGIDFAESERGGDLTYHGPGQLVIYPIIKLDGDGFGPKRDVEAFIRKCERVLIEYLEELGISSGTKPSATGVWSGDRKVASIGIAIRKWVSWHGLAINIANDLNAFKLFSPCGFAPEVMTTVFELRPDLVQAWGTRWRVETERKLKLAFAKVHEDAELGPSAN